MGPIQFRKNSYENHKRCNTDNLWIYFSNDGIKFIKVENIRNNSIDIKGIKHFISEEAHCYQKRSILEENDILFSIAGTIGNTCIIKKEHLPANTNQALAIIGGYLDLVVPKLLKLQLASFITDSTKAKARGGAMNNISLGDLKNLEILIPPLPEQHQIVAKIEELFSELDNGIENLKKAREQLKIYRQAVLKYAFEGKLTKEWRTLQRRAGNPPEPAEKLLEQIKTEREKHYQKQLEDWKNACEQAKTEGKKKPTKPKKPKELPPFTEKELAELPELPQGWCWTRLMQISISFGGYAFKSKDFLEAGKYQVIKMANVKMGYMSLDSNPAFLNHVEKVIIHKYGLKKGDCVVTLTGTRKKRDYGFVAMVKNELNLLLNQRLGVLRFYKPLMPEFFQYALRCHHFQNNFFKHETGNVGQGNVGMKAITEETVVLPPLSEQQAIVEEIESRLSVCDKIEQTIEDSLKKAEALRQSILKKAFAGELTRDWREKHPELITGENSAEKLLEKIKAEKALAAGRGKPRSRKTKKKYYATKEKK